MFRRDDSNADRTSSGAIALDTSNHSRFCRSIDSRVSSGSSNEPARMRSSCVGAVGHPPRDVEHGVLGRPPVGRQRRLLEPRRRHPIELLAERSPTLPLLAQQVAPGRSFGRLVARVPAAGSSSGRYSKTRSRIATSSPRCAPRAASLRSTPSFRRRPASVCTSPGSSRSASSTHRSTDRPATRQRPSGSRVDGEPRPAGTQHHVGLAFGFALPRRRARADRRARAGRRCPPPSWPRRRSRRARAPPPPSAASSTRSALVPTTIDGRSASSAS